MLIPLLFDPHRPLTYQSILTEIIHQIFFYFSYHVMRSERMSRLLVPFADQHVEIPSMTAGNIALTVGLKQVERHTFTFLICYFEDCFFFFKSKKLFKFSTFT